MFEFPGFSPDPSGNPIDIKLFKLISQLLNDG